MKKIITFFIVLALCLETMLIPSFAKVKDEDILETYEAEILPVKGGADAIVTMTFDDGVHATNIELLPLLKEYNLKASLMVVPQRIATSTGSYSSPSQLAELTKEGYLEVQSHSYSHIYIAPEGSADYKEGNNTVENMEREIPGSYEYLTSKFPNQPQVSFAVPGGSYTKEAMDLVMKTFYSARYKNSGASVSSVQSLTPAENCQPGGWYSIRTMWMKNDSLTNLSDYLDACVEQGGWFLTGCHNIVEGGNYDITIENLRKLFEKISEYQEDGKVWVATFSEATRYLREYESSTVKQYKTKDAMFVEVEMAKTTPGGLPLTESIFDMPLTVKISIPEGWANVRLRQNGRDTVVTSFKSAGKTYALAEVIPNSGPVSITNADEPIASTPVNATFTNAPGGATAIATLTFDDGLVGTANALNELCAQYDCKASLMLISDRINATNVAMWEQIFAKGYLSPESHSSNHEYLTNAYPENLTPENIRDEITGSLEDLNNWLPDYDCLGYGIPYSSYTKEAFEELKKSFYSARGGSCVLSYKDYVGKMQSINPKIGSANGNWHQLMTVRLMGEKGAEYPQYAVLTVDNILGYLDKCIKEGGWFIGAAHGIVPGENLDITVEDLGQIMSVMQRRQNSGELWVATMTEATKYIRERQNSKVTAYSTFDGIYVDVTMDDMTADGLPLPEDVFNLDLTVKLQLPDSWGRVVYSQAGGPEKTAFAFEENGLKYVYIDLKPNGGAAYVTNIGDPVEYVESLGMKQSVSADESLTYNLYIPTDSFVIEVYGDAKKLTGKVLGNGYTQYSVGDIDITSAAKEFTFKLKFDEESGYVDYTFKKSVVSYMTDVIESDDVTEKDKQLAYDFLVYAKCMLDKFSDNEDAKTDVRERVEDASALGMVSTPNSGVPADLGTATKVLSGAAFAINEKPYYVFYVNDGFTGKLTFSYGEGADKVETTFDIINGYYHCKKYVILEVDTVYNLALDLQITATGKFGTESVNASGAYSLANFVEGLGGDGAPEYVKALYSYVLSAASYNS